MGHKRSAAAVVALVVVMLTLVALSSAAEVKISPSCAIWCQERCMGTGQRRDECVQQCYTVCERTGRPPLGESSLTDYCNFGCVAGSCFGSTSPVSGDAKTCVARCNNKCRVISAAGIN